MYVQYTVQHVCVYLEGMHTFFCIRTCTVGCFERSCCREKNRSLFSLSKLSRRRDSSKRAEVSQCRNWTRENEIGEDNKR